MSGARSSSQPPCGARGVDALRLDPASMATSTEDVIVGANLGTGIRGARFSSQPPCGARGVELLRSTPSSSAMSGHASVDTFIRTNTSPHGTTYKDLVKELQDDIAMNFALTAPSCTYDYFVATMDSDIPGQWSDMEDDEYNDKELQPFNAEHFHRCHALLRQLARGNDAFTAMVNAKMEQARDERWDTAEQLEFFTDRLCTGREDASLIENYMIDLFSIHVTYAHACEAVVRLRELLGT